MIPITIKSQGKEYTGKVPEGWHEMSVEQFVKVQGKVSGLQLVATLTNLPIDVIENAMSEIDLSMFDWVSKAPVTRLEDEPRKPFFLMGKELDLPTKVEFTMFGQKSLLKALIHEHKDIQHIISDVMALYCQPMVDGSFDSTRLSRVKEAIDKKPIVEVYPWVVFFFRRLLIWRSELQLN